MAVPLTNARAKAQALYDSRRTRTPIPPLTDDDPTLGMADGYAVQRELIDLLLADGDQIAEFDRLGAVTVRVGA